MGRGPLAGPIVAAAVTLKQVRFKNCIRDSKKLSHHQRERAFLEIMNKSIFGLGVMSESVIDALNIQEANRMAMENAVNNLVEKIKRIKQTKIKNAHIHVLIDGNIKLNLKFPVTHIIKGDNKSKSIACASIIAKVLRDRMMDLYDKIYPAYGFQKHKGYPTRLHRTRLKRLGPTPIHRRSFTYA